FVPDSYIRPNSFLASREPRSAALMISLGVTGPELGAAALADDGCRLWALRRAAGHNWPAGNCWQNIRKSFGSFESTIASQYFISSCLSMRIAYASALDASFGISLPMNELSPVGTPGFLALGFKKTK